MVIDAASVKRDVDELKKRVKLLEDKLSSIYKLLKDIEKDLEEI